MTIKRLFILLIVLALALAGCVQRTVVDDSSKPGSEAASDADTETASSVTDEVSSTDTTPAAGGSIAGSYSTGADGVPRFGDVYFDFDRYDIQPSYRQVLDDMSIWLVNNNAILLIEGHCDERGTREYNIALGDRRALSVKDYLLASGVPDLKIEAVSYGEERPSCRSSDEACWGKNRRAHFVFEVVK